MSVRGKYKQYLINKNSPTPKRTRTRYKLEQPRAIQHENSIPCVIPKTIESTISIETPIISSTSISVESDIPDENYVQIQNDNDDELIENNDEELQFDADDLHNILNEEINKEELSAAYLAAFYNCGPTQRTLTDFLQLHNISSSIKLPTTFSGLINVIDESFNALSYKKSWYCGTCMKKLDELNNRFQRECGICKTTKYVLIINFIYILLKFN